MILILIKARKMPMNLCNLFGKSNRGSCTGDNLNKCKNRGNKHSLETYQVVHMDNSRTMRMTLKTKIIMNKERIMIIFITAMKGRKMSLIKRKLLDSTMRHKEYNRRPQSWSPITKL